MRFKRKEMQNIFDFFETFVIYAGHNMQLRASAKHGN
jgi:hypothetical protein